VSDLAFVLRWPNECTEGVTRRDEYEPCDKPAVAVRIDSGGGGLYPVCAYHARADMVLLPDLIAAVQTPSTPLEPWESMALTVATAQLDRGDEPTPNVAAVCIGALERIARGTS